MHDIPYEKSINFDFIFSEETTITIKEIKEPVGEHFKISGRKWKVMTVVFLTIIVTGQTRKGKAIWNILDAPTQIIQTEWHGQGN